MDAVEVQRGDISAVWSLIIQHYAAAASNREQSSVIGRRLLATPDPHLPPTLLCVAAAEAGADVTGRVGWSEIL